MSLKKMTLHWPIFEVSNPLNYRNVENKVGHRVVVLHAADPYSILSTT